MMSGSLHALRPHLLQLCCLLVQTELEVSYGLVPLLQHGQLFLGEAEVVVANAHTHAHGLALLDQPFHALVAVLESLHLEGESERGEGKEGREGEG